MIRTKLAHFESMTIDEIVGRKHKMIPVEHLCAAARNRLAVLELDDLDALLELRFGGKERLWCARFGSVLAPVWWDPHHEVCPSPLRNT